MIRIGFEPMAYSLEGCCSIQLSYRTQPMRSVLMRAKVQGFVYFMHLEPRRFYNVPLRCMKCLVFICCFLMMLCPTIGWSQASPLPWGRIIPLQSNGMQPTRPFRWNKNVAHNASGGLIFFYQNVLSEQVQANCAYTTSCSEYIKQCIQTYGTARGILSGLNQYTKCTGFQYHQHTTLELNRQRKIINAVADERW